MAVIQCEKGHYYDNEKYISCPHCKAEIQGESFAHDDDSVTVALERDQIEDIALAYVKKQSGQRVEMDDERTVGIYTDQSKRKKVVGWLVCLEGAEQGCGYPLYAGFNRIGRGFENDVVLREDLEVSREEHCSIVYENRENIFYIVPKTGNLTYIGDEMVEKAQKMKDRQDITIGQTKLRFVALCTGDWKWEEE